MEEKSNEKKRGKERRRVSRGIYTRGFKPHYAFSRKSRKRQRNPAEKSKLKKEPRGGYARDSKRMESRENKRHLRYLIN